MPIVVIGGHSRNIGKTSVVCALISALPERKWTAIKITQHHPGECETAGHAAAISEELDPTTRTDSSRYLAAGAVRSFWVRTGPHQLAEVMPRIRAVIASSQNVVIESNSVIRFLQPELYATVLDPEVADFKTSALRYLERADAILLPARTKVQSGWTGVPPKLIDCLPKFHIARPDYSSAEFASFVAQRLDAAEAKSL